MIIGLIIGLICLLIITSLFPLKAGGWQVVIPGSLQEVAREGGELVAGGIRPPTPALHLLLQAHHLQQAALPLTQILAAYDLILNALNDEQVRRQS